MFSKLILANVPVLLVILFAVSGCATATNVPTMASFGEGNSQSEYTLSLKDIRGFYPEIKDVHIEFAQMPINIPMSKSSEKVWTGKISAEQVQLLKSSEKLNYPATVVITTMGSRGRLDAVESAIVISTDEIKKSKIKI